jgi:hypothetical protein
MGKTRPQMLYVPHIRKLQGVGAKVGLRHRDGAEDEKARGASQSYLFRGPSCPALPPATPV